MDNARGQYAPPHRRLRVFTYDPGLATQLETSLINQTVLRVRWEPLGKGPVGDYLEVVDYDPASECFYPPVDLDDPALLAQDGVAPSEGNPHFHQQMVYAVAMTTIRHFERALGRKALWAQRLERDPETNRVVRAHPVDRLRIYPHALREANAYYSPDKKALLFGYFPAVLVNPGENLPGGLVFTCLSHDVVAHETTHALLDGLHRYFAEPSNPDVLAFHEAFADVVALFQHFTQPEALRHQIAKTRGDLGRQNLLGALAHQFGQAIGNHGALRDAIGRFDEDTNLWKPAAPTPETYQETTEPHDRGAILVAAMFDAFLSIYRARIADLLRIASADTGKLSDGELHPDLVNRLAEEATKTAGHVLRIAIRALDYCPPVDITFGEYLRALVTADVDLVPDDEWGYRIAVIEAFRRRGIYPRDVRTLAADALRWEAPQPALADFDFSDLIQKLKSGWRPERDEDFPCRDAKRVPADDGDDGAPATLEWQTTSDRKTIGKLNARYQYATWCWLKAKLVDPGTGAVRDAALAEAMGLCPGKDAASTVYRSDADGLPSLEVHSVRSARRPHQDGQTMIDLVVEITQRRQGFVDPKKQAKADALPANDEALRSAKYRPDFVVRGGCTLLIDSESGRARYCVRKPVGSSTRLARQREFAGGKSAPSLRLTYTPAPARGARVAEPFALLHRSR